MTASKKPVGLRRAKQPAAEPAPETMAPPAQKVAVPKTLVSYAYTGADGEIGFDFIVLEGAYIRTSGQVGGLLSHLREGKGYASVAPIAITHLDD